MPAVWIPPLLQKLTDGQERVHVEGATLREVIANLDRGFPGIRSRLCEDDRIRAGIAVAVDGEISPEGLRQRVNPDSEVQFVPADDSRETAGGETCRCKWMFAVWVKSRS